MNLSKRLLVLAPLSCIAVASAQPLPPPGGGLGTSSGVATLYVFGSAAGVGNGADTTEDTLLTYNIPAGTLKAVGDRIRIVASGSFAGSTDSKSARVRLNGATAFQVANGTTATMGAWFIYVEIQQFGAGATQQLLAAYSVVQNGAIGSGSATAALGNTSPIALTVTGTNATTATANTINVRYVAVEYLP